MLLNKVDEQLLQRGFLLPRVWTVNFLVAFKSKPLMILIGPREAEKEALVIIPEEREEIPAGETTHVQLLGPPPCEDGRP